MTVELVPRKASEARLIEQFDPPIHYIKGQWAVTGFGIECITSPYEIKKADLADARWGNPTMPQWPRHMAKMEWVNTDKFLDAFEAALKAHTIKQSFRPDWKEATCKMIDEDEARLAAIFHARACCIQASRKVLVNPDRRKSLAAFATLSGMARMGSRESRHSRFHYRAYEGECRAHSLAKPREFWCNSVPLLLRPLKQERTLVLATAP